MFYCGISEDITWETKMCEVSVNTSRDAAEVAPITPWPNLFSI